MRRTLVVIVVGLTPDHVGENTPNIGRIVRSGAMRPLRTIEPAVTCSVQATFMTGLPPREHGVVANGWLFRDLLEIMFWRQSNRLVTGEKIWEAGRRRDPSFTCANLCWWYNMGASHDFGLTPRPIYKADGRKLPDCYTTPASLRDELTAELGPFPLFQYWGPGTSIASSSWIARALAHVMARHRPTLALGYLPHLDYDLQRHGPDESHEAVARSLREVDAVVGELAAEADRLGYGLLILSEYGIVKVSRPVHLNRVLRQAGYLDVREEMGRELLDPVASRAFAVADHQIAHVYVAQPDQVDAVARLLGGVPGVAEVLDEAGKRARGLDHSRSGELVVISEPDAWFTYYYWEDDRRAPDFARTVEIHRKPGYDPVELFVDPAIKHPKLAIGRRLAQRKLGFRTLLDIVPLDAELVRGSHGRLTSASAGPLVISGDPYLLPDREISALEIKELVLEAVFGATVAAPLAGFEGP